MYQWISCNKRQITAVYCNIDHHDGVPWTDDDLYGWKTDLKPGRQLYTESGRKRKLLSHSDSGHLVFTDFCDLLIRTAKQLSDVIFMRQEAMQKQPIWQESILLRTKLATYAISGCMAALSGLILLSRLGSAQPTLGEGYELDAIAAVALGGTSMNGGRGKIWGTFIGVLIIAVLNNGLNIMGVSSYYQDVVKRNCNFDRGIV